MFTSVLSDSQAEVLLLAIVAVLLTIDIALHLGLASLLRRSDRAEESSVMQAGPAGVPPLDFTIPDSSLPSCPSTSIPTPASEPVDVDSLEDRCSKADCAKPSSPIAIVSKPSPRSQQIPRRRKRIHSSSSSSSSQSSSARLCKPLCSRDPSFRRADQFQAARNSQTIEKLKRDLAQIEAKMASNAVQTFCQRLLLSNTVWKQEKELGILRSIAGVIGHNSTTLVPSTAVAVA